MAKKGMKRPEISSQTTNKPYTVPAIQGKAKCGKIPANPIIPHTEGASLKVYHETPHAKSSGERPIADAYPEIDNDLARDNLENNLTAADLQDLS